MTSTHHRPLAQPTSAQNNSSLPQPKGTDNTQLRAGSLSIRSRRNPVMVDDDVTLARTLTLIRSTDFKQIDNLPTGYRDAPLRAIPNAACKPAQENSKSTEAEGISFGAISSAINKEIRKDKVPGKSTEPGGIFFGAISDAIDKEIRKNSKARQTVAEPAGPVINIGRPPNSTPWYLRPQYADQLDTDDKGNVRSGSLLSLVEMLTTDPGVSDTTSELGIVQAIYTTDTDELAELAQFKTFTNVFLTTFRTFTTADNLFDMLVERFHLKPREPLTEYERLDWKTNLRNPVQRLVLDIFSIWLENYQLLEEEPHIAQRLKDFLSPIVPSPHNETAIIIIQTIDRLVRWAVRLSSLSDF